MSRDLERRRSAVRHEEQHKGVPPSRSCPTRQNNDQMSSLLATCSCWIVCVHVDATLLEVQSPEILIYKSVSHEVKGVSAQC